MKKFFVYASLFTLAISGYAEEVTPQQALARVFRSRADRGLLMAPVNNYKVVLTETLNDKKTLYVFSSPTQTLILPADDVVEAPILGRFDSPLKSGEELPPVVKWWFGEYSRQIAWMAEQAESAKENLSYSSKSLKATVQESYHDVAPLMTTKWGQDEPYNYFTPGDGLHHTVTCCVATAFAQVMNYHKYPTGPCKGSGSATIGNKPVPDMSFEGLVFDWSNMKDTYSSVKRPLDDSEITPEQRAVATLMVACGFASKVNYGYEGSGAMTSDLVNGAINNFGYNKGMNIENRDLYSYDEWVAKLYKELTTNGPIIYGGWGPGFSNGHQFVLDGFEAKTQMFHTNWGWRGVSDGYFKIDALNPGDQGIGGGALNFNTFQDAVFGFTPNYDGAEVGRPHLGFVYEPVCNVSDNNLNIFWGSGERGLFNFSAFASDVQIGVKITNREKTYDNTYAVLSQHMDAGFLDEGVHSLTVTLPKELESGTYDVQLVYSYKSNSWEEIQTTPELRNYFRISKKDGQISLVDLSPILDVTDDFPSHISFGQNISYTATFTNATDKKAISEMSPFLFYQNENDELEPYCQMGMTQFVELTPGESLKLIFSSKITSLLPSSAKKFFIGYRNNFGTISGLKEVTIDQATSCYIENHYLMSKDIQINTNLRLFMRLRNVGETLQNFEADIALVSKNDSSNSHVLCTMKTAINPLSQITVNVNQLVPLTVTPGEYYLTATIKGIQSPDFEEPVKIYGAGDCSDINQDNLHQDVKYFNPATGTIATPDAGEKNLYIEVSKEGSKKIIL